MRHCTATPAWGQPMRTAIARDPKHVQVTQTHALLSKEMAVSITFDFKCDKFLIKSVSSIGEAFREADSLNCLIQHSKGFEKLHYLCACVCVGGECCSIHQPTLNHK